MKMINGMRKAPENNKSEKKLSSESLGAVFPLKKFYTDQMIVFVRMTIIRQS